MNRPDLGGKKVIMGIQMALLDNIDDDYSQEKMPHCGIFYKSRVQTAPAGGANLSRRFLLTPSLKATHHTLP